MTVLEAQKFGAVLGPAAGFLPEFGGLNDRHGKFDGARAVHFLADDGGNLAHDAHAHRHEREHTCCKLFDEAGTGRVDLAGNFGVGRSFLERLDEKLTGAHECRIAK